MRAPNQLSAVTKESLLFPTTMDSELFWNWGKKYIQVQHNDFIVNSILLHNFKESFFHYLNLGEQLAIFSGRSSRRFSSTVSAYWKSCMGESWPRLWVQTSLRLVCTHVLGQDSPIQTCLSSAFNKHRRSTKSVGCFVQRSRLLFPLNLSNERKILWSYVVK